MLSKISTQEVTKIWEQVKQFYKGKGNTPYLVTENDKIVVKETEDYLIETLDNVIIFPTKFQKLFYKETDLVESEKIEIIKKEINTRSLS